MTRRTAKNSKQAQIDWSALHREAAERFGIESFRPGQRDAIEAILNGYDVLAIMPTGAGKSLIYQLASLFLPKATIVVSPLISLMQDQQEKAEDAEIGAATLNSTLTQTETRETVEEIRANEHKLIYVTPERLENPEYLQLLAKSGVSLFVIDEAHCISQWGHDFRPAYLALRHAGEALGRPPILALTATAPQEISDDIVKQLGLKQPILVNTGLERPNLYMEVFRTVNGEAKRAKIREIINDSIGVGIVYTATVRQCNELHKWLQDEGIEAGIYHGKCKVRERQDTQFRFMQSKYKVIVATKAFGLGIDKSDIRFVIHYSFPDSLESYYQEAGRAGRDGQLSRCALLYRLEDRRIQGYFLGGKYPSREHSLRVYLGLLGLRQNGSETSATGADRGDNRKIKLSDLVKASGLPERRVKVIVAQLEATGVLARSHNAIVSRREFSGDEELNQVLTEYERLAHSDRDRLRVMMGYAETASCRVKYLLKYFDQANGEEQICGHCDNCVAAQPIPNTARDSSNDPKIGEVCAVGFPAQGPAAKRGAHTEVLAFDIGDQVRHKKFGQGEVLEINGRNVAVRFSPGRKVVRGDFLKKAA